VTKWAHGIAFAPMGGARETETCGKVTILGEHLAKDAIPALIVRGYRRNNHFLLPCLRQRTLRVPERATATMKGPLLPLRNFSISRGRKGKLQPCSNTMGN
jgi:hypothetical protein